MFEPDVRHTFSDLWYRVGPTRPALSPHARVTRQHYGPSIVYIVEDPASGQFYRMSEAAYFFIGLLDGVRTVDEAWDSCNVQLGDGAPTQRDCIDVLSKLQMFGLLRGTLPLAPDMVLERKNQARTAKRQKRTGRWLFLSLPLVNPEPFLERHKHIVKAVFSKWGLAIWSLVLLIAIWMVVGDERGLSSEFNLDALARPEAVLGLTIVFLLLRALHELGHAAACKAMGGRSTEIGVIMIVMMLPLPYCDATSAWRFPETWRRVVVSLGGVLFELFLAAIAGIIWATTETQSIAHGISYQVMLISSVATFLFNMNPLLRYDGYYILSDLAGVPNLQGRSKDLWRFLFERFAFGIRGLRPPYVRDRAEAWLMGTFGLCSFPYRMFIMTSICMLVASKYLTLGVVAALLVGVIWFVWPLFKLVGYLASSPRLMGRRTRAVSCVGAAIAVLLLLTAVIPVPAAGYATATIEPTVRAPLRNEVAGFVTEVLAQVNDDLEQGDPIIHLSNPQLKAEEAGLLADLGKARALLDQAMESSPTDRELAQLEIESIELALGDLLDRKASLIITAPISGRLIPTEDTRLGDLVGQFFTPGTLFGFVATADDVVVRTAVPDREVAYIFGGWSPDEEPDDGPKASVRVQNRPGHVIQATIVRIEPAGTRELANPSLAVSAGGNILVDQTESNELKTVEPHTTVELKADAPADELYLGMRAKVRFEVEPRPLASQWWRKLRQYFTSKNFG